MILKSILSNNKAIIIFSAFLSILLVSCERVLDNSGTWSTDQSANSNDKSYCLDDYYYEYLDSKIEQIKSNEDDFSFAFITDLHWEVNDKKSPAILSYLFDKTDISRLIMCGDYISKDYPSDIDAFANVSNCLNCFDFENRIAILGNHESNAETTGKNVIEDKDTLYRMLNNGDYLSDFFFINDDETKTSFLFFNSFEKEITESQAQSFLDCITRIDEEYTAFIFIHVFFDYVQKGVETRISKCGNQLNSLINQNIDDIKCNIACIFSGHCHKDNVLRNENGYYCISSYSDSRESAYEVIDPSERKEHTINEQSFDIVKVNLSLRRISIIKIGFGHDRELFF